MTKKEIIEELKELNKTSEERKIKLEESINLQDYYLL